MLASVQNRDRHLWTVVSWVTERGPEGNSCDFSVWVSPELMQIAREVELSDEKVSVYARACMRSAGYKMPDYQRVIHLGEWGIERFDLSAGEGKWLALDVNEVSRCDIEKEGAIFSTHNIDHAIEQSPLFGLFLWWVQYLEMLYERKRETE